MSWVQILHMTQRTKRAIITMTYQHVGKVKTKKDWSVEIEHGLEETPLSFHTGTNCIVNIWKLWISSSNSEWIWAHLLCYKKGEVNYSVFNVHVNCVGLELGSRGHASLWYIGHNELKPNRKH